MIISNITQNTQYNLKFKLNSDDYDDFKLSNIGEDVVIYDGLNEYDDNVMAYIDFTSPYCYRSDSNVHGFSVASLPNYKWVDAVNSGFTLPTYWLTGLDNGSLTCTEPISGWVESFTFTRQPMDYKLRLKPIDGFLRSNSYYIYRTDDGLECNGGFLQGVFKLFGKDYQVLPTSLSNKSFEFVLNRNVSDSKINILNEKNPNNEGIFFFMGTRAENKFWYFSNKTGTFELREDVLTKVVGGGDSSTTVYDSEIIGGDSSDVDYDCWISGGDSSEIPVNDDYYRVINCGSPSGGSYDHVFDGGSPSDEDRFIDKIFNGGNPQTVYGSTYYSFFEEPPFYLSHVYTPYPKFNFFETLKKDFPYLSFIKTDVLTTNNKYLFFNNTQKEGTYTTDTWSGDTYQTYYSPKLNNTVNYYTKFNNTSTGTTTDNASDDILYDKNISIVKDLVNNCIAFRLTEDNKIGYRIITSDCSSSGYTIIEEYSESISISGDTHIIVKALPNLDEKLILSFYVNGKLVLSSNPIPNIVFHELDELKEKQYGVPFNVSIGGGSLGLYEQFLGSDLITDECKRFWTDNILPIEKNFSGTFIGTIKKFKMYDESLTYDKIKNNFKLTNNNVKKIFYGIGSNIYELNQFKQKINFYLNGYGYESDYVSLNIPKVWGVLKSINIKTIYDELIPQTNWFTEPVVVLMNNIEYYSYTSKVPLNGNANFVALF